MKKALSVALLAFFAAPASGLYAVNAQIAETLPAEIVNGTIGYAMTDRTWASYQTPEGKEECPAGLNEGPAERFVKLFPKEGQNRTVAETQLAQEGDALFPFAGPERIPLKTVAGKISHGMNLDGVTSADDFVSPQGERGIDNQFYRAGGCILRFRRPVAFDQGDTLRSFYNQNRIVIKITGVDSLANDNDVTVHSYRGADQVAIDASGRKTVPGGTQHIDERWGKFAESTWKGKIVDGVLITEPAPLTIPAGAIYNAGALLKFKGSRFSLRLTPTYAEGVMAGYIDVAHLHRYLATTLQHESANIGRVPLSALVRALQRLADGYPDPTSGKMTAVSAAMNVRFTQVYVVHAQP